VNRNHCGTATAEGNRQGFSVGRSNPNTPPKSNRLLTAEVEVRHTFQNRSLPKRKISRLPKANGSDGRSFQSPLDSSDWRPSKFRSGLQPHAQNDFVLTAADVDQVATTHAREALRAGQVPADLAGYPKQILQKIADGEESLYTKRLLPPEAAEIRVHAQFHKAALLSEKTC